MEEKKKNKGLMPIVIALVILILGLIGYIYYDDKVTILSSSEEKESKTEKEVTEGGNWKDIALDDSKFYSLYTTLKGFTYDRSRGAGYKDFNRIELAALAYGTAEVSKDDFTIISTNTEDGSTKASFNPNVVTKNVKEIFNNDDISIDYNRIKSIDFYNISAQYELTNSNIDKYISSCGFNIDSYDETTNKLTVDFYQGCGGTTGPSAKITERKIISAKEKDDTIVVVEKAIYYEMTSYDNNVRYNIYGDNTKQDFLGDVSSSQDQISNVAINVDSYLDKASTITHTYKLNADNNKYYFVSSVIN